MTWLKAVNVFLLQFFFIRLVRFEDELITNVTIKEASFMSNDTIGIGDVVMKKKTFEWYGLRLWVVPFTGWGKKNEFTCLTKKPSFVQITAKKEKRS
jgi:hypothetical protein